MVDSKGIRNLYTSAGAHDDIPQEAEQRALEDNAEETIGVPHHYQLLTVGLLKEGIQPLQVERVENIHHLEKKGSKKNF